MARPEAKPRHLNCLTAPPPPEAEPVRPPANQADRYPGLACLPPLPATACRRVSMATSVYRSALSAILQPQAGRYTAIVVPVRLAEPPTLHVGRYMLSSVSARLAFFPTPTGGPVQTLHTGTPCLLQSKARPQGRRQCRIVWQSGRTAARHFPRINVAFSSYSLELNTELNSRRYPPPGVHRRP